MDLPRAPPRRRRWWLAIAATAGALVAATLWVARLRDAAPSIDAGSPRTVTRASAEPEPAAPEVAP
jgi:hypothetical protein